MTDLHSLLDAASRPTSSNGQDSLHDVGPELRLGRRALTRRRIATAGGGVAATAVILGAVIGGGALFAGPSQDAVPAASPLVSASAPSVTGSLIDADQTVGDYHFTKKINGYNEAQSDGQSVVMFLPDSGGADRDPRGPWLGKVVVALDNVAKGSTSAEKADNKTSIVRTVTVGGESRILWVQLPAGAGLTPAELHTFAESIDVLRIPPQAN